MQQDVLSVSLSLLFVFPARRLISRTKVLISKKSASKSFAKTKTESKTLICRHSRPLCAKNLPRHSRHLLHGRWELAGGASQRACEQTSAFSLFTLVHRRARLAVTLAVRAEWTAPGLKSLLIIQLRK